MTCVIGFKSRDNIYMSCDEEISNGYTKEFLSYSSAKIIKRQGILFGICGSCVLMDLIRYELKIPAWDLEKYSTRAYLHKMLIPSLKRCFDKNNFSEIKDNVIEIYGEILIGISTPNAFPHPYHSILAKIQSDFSCVEIQKNYNAIGCGKLAALGAMYAAEKTNAENMPDELIRMNLKIAQNAANCFNSGVGNEIMIKTLRDSDDALGYEKD